MKRPSIGDERLDQQTAERSAKTVNKLKGAATILFIAHQLPDGLAVDIVHKLSPLTQAQRLAADKEQPE